MPTRSRRVALLLAGALASACVSRGPERGTALRLHVLDVGLCQTSDVSDWTPGTAPGTPWLFPNHCYLIRHRNGLLLWDTGFCDDIAALPDGLQLAGGSLQIRVNSTLAAQLADLGVAPASVTHLALSHFHMDHAGNANLFAGATLLVQQELHDAAFGPTPERYGFQPQLYDRLRQSRTLLLHGDHDVFGDGSVVILATPGHTPGHQSLLVRLPHTGAVVLSGDLAHLRANWQYRRVPVHNFDREQSLRSMERIAQLVADERAQLWINHDREHDAAVPKSPAFVD